MRRLDRFLTRRVLGREAQVVEGETCLGGKEGGQHFHLVEERRHACRIKLPQRRLVAVRVGGKRQEAGHGRLVLLLAEALDQLLLQTHDVLLRHRVELRPDLCPEHRPQRRLHDAHASPRNPRMPERSLCIRAEDDRDEQGMRRLVGEHLREPAVLVVLRPVRQKVRFPVGLPEIVTAQDCIAFGEEIRGGVDLASRICAVDTLNGRIAVRTPADVQEAARGNERREHRRPVQDVGVIEPVDLAELCDVSVKAVKHDAIRQRVHCLGAPAEGIGERPEFLGDERRNALHRLFHVVVVISKPDPALLRAQFPAQRFDAHAEPSLPVKILSHEKK